MNITTPPYKHHKSTGWFNPSKGDFSCARSSGEHAMLEVNMVLTSGLQNLIHF